MTFISSAGSRYAISAVDKGSAAGLEIARIGGGVGIATPILTIGSDGVTLVNTQMHFDSNVPDLPHIRITQQGLDEEACLRFEFVSSKEEGVSQWDITAGGQEGADLNFRHQGQGLVITLPASLEFGTTTMVSPSILRCVLRQPTFSTQPCSLLSS